MKDGLTKIEESHLANLDPSMSQLLDDEVSKLERLIINQITGQNGLLLLARVILKSLNNKEDKTSLSAGVQQDNYSRSMDSSTNFQLKP